VESFGPKAILLWGSRDLVIALADAARPRGLRRMTRRALRQSFAENCRLPRVRWEELFANANPVEVEIGSGNGAFLRFAAERNPGVNFFGIEKRRSRAEQAARSLRAAGLSNAIVINADAVCVIATLVPEESVQAYHIYFPDPWPKRRHRRRRLFGSGNANLAEEICRTLRPGGRVHLASDLPEHLRSIVKSLLACGHLREAAPSGQPLVTHFAQKYGRQGRPLFRVSLTRS